MITLHETIVDGVNVAGHRMNVAITIPDTKVFRIITGPNSLVQGRKIRAILVRVRPSIDTHSVKELIDGVDLF
jgi:hypothetical protein